MHKISTFAAKIIFLFLLSIERLRFSFIVLIENLNEATKYVRFTYVYFTIQASINTLLYVHVQAWSIQFRLRFNILQLYIKLSCFPLLHLNNGFAGFSLFFRLTIKPIGLSQTYEDTWLWDYINKNNIFSAFTHVISYCRFYFWKDFGKVDHIELCIVGKFQTERFCRLKDYRTTHGLSCL